MKRVLPGWTNGEAGAKTRENSPPLSSIDGKTVSPAGGNSLSPTGGTGGTSGGGVGPSNGTTAGVSVVTGMAVVTATEIAGVMIVSLGVGGRHERLESRSSALLVPKGHLSLTRPGLILPKGARFHAAQGAQLENVQAAVFHSPYPLENAKGCAVASAAPFDQVHEGVVQGGATRTSDPVSSGHICTYLDTPENTDFDNVFDYYSGSQRSRGRVDQPIDTNDRVYALGGRLVGAFLTTVSASIAPQAITPGLTIITPAISVAVTTAIPVTTLTPAVVPFDGPTPPPLVPPVPPVGDKEFLPTGGTIVTHDPHPADGTESQFSVRPGVIIFNNIHFTVPPGSDGYLPISLVIGGTSRLVSGVDYRITFRDLPATDCPDFDSATAPKTCYFFVPDDVSFSRTLSDGRIFHTIQLAVSFSVPTVDPVDQDVEVSIVLFPGTSQEVRYTLPFSFI